MRNLKVFSLFLLMLFGLSGKPNTAHAQMAGAAVGFDLVTTAGVLADASASMTLQESAIASANIEMNAANAAGEWLKVAARSKEIQIREEFLRQAEQRYAEAYTRMQQYFKTVGGAGNTMISVLFSIGTPDQWNMAMHPEYGFDTMGPQGASNGYGDSTGGGGQSAFWDWIDSLGGGGWGKGKTDPCDDGTWKPSDPAWDNKDFCATGITAESESRYSLIDWTMANMARAINRPIFLDGAGYFHIEDNIVGIATANGDFVIVTVNPLPEFGGFAEFNYDADNVLTEAEIYITPMDDFLTTQVIGHF